MSNVTAAHTTYHSFPRLSTRKTAISQLQTFGNFSKNSQLKIFLECVLSTQFTNSHLFAHNPTIKRSDYGYKQLVTA